MEWLLEDGSADDSLCEVWPVPDTDALPWEVLRASPGMPLPLSWLLALSTSLRPANNSSDDGKGDQSTASLCSLLRLRRRTAHVASAMKSMRPTSEDAVITPTDRALFWRKPLGDAAGRAAEEGEVEEEAETEGV